MNQVWILIKDNAIQALFFHKNLINCEETILHITHENQNCLSLSFQILFTITKNQFYDFFIIKNQRENFISFLRTSIFSFLGIYSKIRKDSLTYKRAWKSKEY